MTDDDDDDDDLSYVIFAWEAAHLRLTMRGIVAPLTSKEGRVVIYPSPYPERLSGDKPGSYRPLLVYRYSPLPSPVPPPCNVLPRIDFCGDDPAFRYLTAADPFPRWRFTTCQSYSSRMMWNDIMARPGRR